MGSDQQGVTHGTDAGPDCLPVGSVGLPCCTPGGAGHTHCRGTRASKAASSVCPGVPLLVDASVGQLQVFWAGGPLACSPGVLRNGAQPSVHGQTRDKSGPFVEVSCLLSFFFFFFFLPPVILIQCQPCAKHCSGCL